MQQLKQWGRLMLAIMFAATLAACGSSGGGTDADGDTGGDDGGSGGGDDTPTVEMVELSGVAATGAPIVGNVQAVNANGDQSQMVIINSDGSFSVSVPKGAPYMLYAIDSVGVTYHSYAAQAGTVNITPLTDLALFIANNNDPVDDLYLNWATGNQSITTEQITDAAEYLIGGLRDLMQAEGVNPDEFDLFTSPFSADGSGFDGVLDQIEVDLDVANGTFTVTGPGGEPIDFDISDEVPPEAEGDWTLVITGNVTMFGITTRVPSITLENIAAPSGSDLDYVEQEIRDAYEKEMTIETLEVTLVSESANQIVFDIDFAGTGQGVTMTYHLTYTYTR